MEDVKPPEEEPKFFIDPSWYEEKNKSFQVIAQRRMCDSCREKLGTPVEERVPVVDGTSGRVVFEPQMVPYGSDPIKTIVECCSKTPSYLDPRLPLMEIIFRIFLSMGNQPLSLEELRRAVEEWIGPTDGRIVTISVLQRLLESDNHYGIRRFLVSSRLEAVQVDRDELTFR